MAVELLVARNPDQASTLPYLLRLPVAGGLVFRVRETWPRTKAVYCHPVPASEWPQDPELVERVPLRACTRRGPAIDIVADRSRQQRSQLVFTRARGREVVFWQSPRTTRQSRPDVRLPTARAAGVDNLVIVVDPHERYPYRFPSQQATTVRRALRCGDYAVELDGEVVAAVERKTLPDLVSSLTSGRLGYALGELAALPRAAVVVEERYSRVFRLDHVRPSVVADGLAELQLRWATVPIVWGENRPLAEEWTYRYLAAAYRWAEDERAAHHRLQGLVGRDTSSPMPAAVATPGPSAAPNSTAEIRTWARERGFAVSDRGRLPAQVVAAWAATHGTG